jgi:hypothetical protein
MPLTRRLILQKARRHPPAPQKARQAPTDCRRTVSGTISLPSRGTFHHSLTVLSAIGHQGVFSLTRWSWQIHGRLQESAATRDTPPQATHFRLPDSHRLRSAFPNDSANMRLYHCAIGCQPDPRHPTTPHAQPLTGITHAEFRLNPLSLATTHGITIVFSSYRY